MKTKKHFLIFLFALLFSAIYSQTESELISSEPVYQDDYTTTPANILPTRSSNSSFIENITISNNLEGAVPTDIIFLSDYNKFYVYGKRRLLVIDATTNLITESLEISDHSQYDPVERNSMSNMTNHEEHMVLVNFGEDQFVYCVTESLEMIKINPYDDSWETVVTTPSNMLDENFYSNMKIKYDPRTNRIYWMVSMDLWGGSIFVYEVSNSTTNFINRIDIEESGFLTDIAVNHSLDEFYVGTSGGEIRVYNTLDFSYSVLVNTGEQRGDFLYIDEAGHHKLYCFERSWKSTDGHVYQIDFNNNNSLTSFTQPLPTETACYYNSATDEIYLGFHKTGTQNDIVVLDPSTNSIIAGLNTYIYSDDFNNEDISFSRHNGNVLLCKNNEIVLIDELTYSFNAIEVAQFNMFMKCAVSNTNALVISPWSGNIKVIGSSNTIESNINVGASLFFGCFNPDKSKAYFYHKEFQDKSRVYILNTLTNSISHLEMGNRISDMFVYSPDENTNRVYVSFYDDTHIVKAIDGETDIITDPQYWIYLNEEYCASMLLAPNNKLYCINGLDNEGSRDAGVEIRDASNNFSYIASHYYPDISINEALSGKLCYNPNTSMVYATTLDLNMGGTYGKLTEIDGITNIGTDYQVNSKPYNIVCNKSNNNVYIQHTGSQLNVSVYNPKDQSVSEVYIGYKVMDIEMDETRNLVFISYRKEGSQGLGFIDNYDFAPGIDLPQSTFSIKFNPENSSIYAYVPHNHWSLIPEEAQLWQCTLDSYIDINDYNISTQSISLQNWHTFKNAGLLFNNDILIDEAQNKIFVANGGHSNISTVSYEPEDYLVINPGITWLSIPRHLRTVNSETSYTYEVFAQRNLSVPYTNLTLDYNNINENMGAGSSNEVSAIYQTQHWFYEEPIMQYIDSRRGYILHDINPPAGRYLKLEGTQENPASEIELFCKKNNWIGYFIEEEQNVFDALADIEEDIYHIQLQYANCYRYNFPVSNQCGTKSTNDYSPGTWICNGTPNIKYGEMAKVTPLGDISNFQWNYSGNPPSSLVRPEIVYYEFEEKSSYETFVLVLDTTTTNPTEIGAFVNDTCVGACSVISEDSVVVLSAYIEGAPGDSVTFEQYFGGQKNSNIHINSYFVKNMTNNVFEKRAVKTGEKQDAFIINFNTENNDDSNFGKEINLYPNPVSDNLNYSFELENESNVKITLFDLNGRRIGILIDKKFKKGYASGNININKITANKLNSGIYIINITINSNTYNRKLIFE